MCGIIGYIGKNRKASDIIDFLSMLEYRGYDSAGISGFSEGKLEIKKEVGAIDNLRKAVPAKWTVSCAIAHTRWATHGASSKENAHPHQSNNKKWVLVHNGIIENFKELKNRLKQNPEGESDTAVLVEYMAEKNMKTFEDFVSIFQDIKGSYAILCQNAENANELFIAKKDSPLYVASDDEGNFYLASDPICFMKFTNSYKVFNDNEFAYIKDQKIFFVDQNLQPIVKESVTLKEDAFQTSKQTYSHYMLKEINEEPEAIRRQVLFYKEEQVLNSLKEINKENISYVKFLGCGTAYHAAMVGAKYFEKIAGITASAEIASEFIYNTNVMDFRKTLFVFVSQSGETADTLHALNIAKQRGATCIALTNVGYSTLAQKSHFVLPICAGPEISVASTKAYVCQLSALYMLAHHFAGDEAQKSYDKLWKLSKQLFNFDVKEIERIANFLIDKNDMVLIGKDIDFITAREGALKIKETSYANANGCPSGELKHGYLAIISQNTPIISVATNPKTNLKTFNSLTEAAARGATKILITNDECCGCDYCIKIPNLEDELLNPILAVVPLQFLAFRLSVLKGFNPDKPRNLAKSVTVE